MTESVASSTFEVTLKPDGGVDPAVGSMAIAKIFHGDLEGTSVGQMLAIRSPVEGLAGYVAMERVTGSLAGRSGGFALQHNGVMDRGAPSLVITVVPDSGTEGLKGLHGQLEIEITGSEHHYRFRYGLPAYRRPSRGAAALAIRPVWHTITAQASRARSCVMHSAPWIDLCALAESSACRIVAPSQ